MRQLFTLMLGFSPSHIASLFVITGSQEVGFRLMVSRAWFEMFFSKTLFKDNFNYPVLKR